MQDNQLDESGEDDLEGLVKTVAYCMCPFARFRTDRMRTRCRSKKYKLLAYPTLFLLSGTKSDLRTTFLVHSSKNRHGILRIRRGEIHTI